MRAGWRAPTTALVLAGLAGQLGACGGGGEAVRAPSPSPSASGASTAPPTATPVPTATASAAASSPAASSATPAPTVAMKAVAPSAMEGKLREIGLDPMALPPLNKLDPKSLRDVMNTFTRSLGVGCGHCHEKDFRAPTANKKIATHMWNDFARGLAVEGGALYCDSCHGGHARFLDRHDLGALGAWMDESYVGRLKRTDKKDHGCETCHGDPFEGKILAVRWK